MSEKFLLAYADALILYDTLEEAELARTDRERLSHMEVYRVQFGWQLPPEKESA